MERDEERRREHVARAEVLAGLGNRGGLHPDALAAGRLNARCVWARCDRDHSADVRRRVQERRAGDALLLADHNRGAAVGEQGLE